MRPQRPSAAGGATGASLASAGGASHTQPMRRGSNSEALNAPFRRVHKAQAAAAAARPAGVAAQHVCMAPGCLLEAPYRAPMSRDHLNQYYWFCLEHVRAYNARWDYFRGMSQADIERELKRDVTWQRPSWPLGGGPGIHDPLGLLGDEPQTRRQVEERVWTKEARALAVLDLPATATISEVKARYKTLAKRLHPDITGADKEAEERLKIVNQAYSTLKAAYAQVA
jgi:DnaJ-domain-containing protein 1